MIESLEELANNAQLLKAGTFNAEFWGLVGVIGLGTILGTALITAYGNYSMKRGKVVDALAELVDVQEQGNAKNSLSILRYNEKDEGIQHVCTESSVDYIGALVLAKKIGGWHKVAPDTINGKIVPAIHVWNPIRLSDYARPEDPIGFYIRLLGGFPFADAKMTSGAGGAQTYSALVPLGRSELERLARTDKLLDYKKDAALAYGLKPDLPATVADFSFLRGVVEVVVYNLQAWGNIWGRMERASK